MGKRSIGEERRGDVGWVGRRDTDEKRGEVWGESGGVTQMRGIRTNGKRIRRRGRCSVEKKKRSPDVPRDVLGPTC